MFEIGHGIEVYYGSNKNCPNMVYFADGTSKKYNDGGMLFEIIGDETIYMLTDKVENMIRAFPDKDQSLSNESIVGCFKWLYGTIEDEEKPVATELFRSSFNKSIQEAIAIIESEDEYGSVEEFFMHCYHAYMNDIKMFCMYVDAIAATASGISDENQQRESDEFTALVEQYYEGYTKKLKVRGGIYEVVLIDTFILLLIFEQCRMIRNGVAIKECVNCGCIFIPTGRKDAIYCHLPSPDCPEKTCKEVGAYMRRKMKRQTDQKEHEHYNYMGREYNAVRRLVNSEKTNKTEEMIAYHKKHMDDEMKRYYRQKENEES